MTEERILIRLDEHRVPPPRPKPDATRTRGSKAERIAFQVGWYLAIFIGVTLLAALLWGCVEVWRAIL